LTEFRAARRGTVNHVSVRSTLRCWSTKCCTSVVIGAITPYFLVVPCYVCCFCQSKFICSFMTKFLCSSFRETQGNVAKLLRCQTFRAGALFLHLRVTKISACIFFLWLICLTRFITCLSRIASQRLQVHKENALTERAR